MDISMIESPTTASSTECTKNEAKGVLNRGEEKEDAPIQSKLDAFFGAKPPNEKDSAGDSRKEANEKKEGTEKQDLKSITPDLDQSAEKEKKLVAEKKEKKDKKEKKAQKKRDSETKKDKRLKDANEVSVEGGRETKRAKTSPLAKTPPKPRKYPISEEELFRSPIKHGVVHPKQMQVATADTDWISVPGASIPSRDDLVAVWLFCQQFAEDLKLYPFSVHALIDAVTDHSNTPLSPVNTLLVPVYLTLLEHILTSNIWEALEDSELSAPLHEVASLKSSTVDSGGSVVEVKWAAEKEQEQEQESEVEGLPTASACCLRLEAHEILTSTCWSSVVVRLANTRQIVAEYFTPLEPVAKITTSNFMLKANECTERVGKKLLGGKAEEILQMLRGLQQDFYSLTTDQRILLLWFLSDILMSSDEMKDFLDLHEEARTAISRKLREDDEKCRLDAFEERKRKSALRAIVTEQERREKLYLAGLLELKKSKASPKAVSPPDNKPKSKPEAKPEGKPEAKQEAAAPPPPPWRSLELSHTLQKYIPGLSKKDV
eukprot:Platyproteum_vivax@DN12063_c0_g1_i1.p1